MFSQLTQLPTDAFEDEDVECNEQSDNNEQSHDEHSDNSQSVSDVHSKRKI